MSDSAWMRSRVISPLSWPMYVDGCGGLAGAFPFCWDPFKPSLPFFSVPLDEVRWESLVPFETTRVVPFDDPGPSPVSASMFVRRRRLAEGRRSADLVV